MNRAETYNEKVFRMRNPWGGLTPQYYATNMDMEIVDEFVNNTLPGLKEERKKYDSWRGRFIKKLIEAGGRLPLSEITECRLFIGEMLKRGHCGIGIDGFIYPDCICEWCSAEGPTCTQYRWNRLLDRW